MRLLTAVSLVRVRQGEPPKKPLLSTKIKGVFLCFLEEKQAKSGKTSAKQTPERKISRPEARFFVFRGFPSPKMLVYFLRFFVLQRNKKSVRTVGLEPEKFLCLLAFWKLPVFPFSTIWPRGFEPISKSQIKKIDCRANALSRTYRRYMRQGRTRRRKTTRRRVPFWRSFTQLPLLSAGAKGALSCIALKSEDKARVIFSPIPGRHFYCRAVEKTAVI